MTRNWGKGRSKAAAKRRKRREHVLNCPLCQPFARFVYTGT